jgi:hypothetical protein
VIPDGVFAQDSHGKLVFHALRPKEEGVAKILSRIARKSARLPKRLDLDSVLPDALDLVRMQPVQGELATGLGAAEQSRGRLLANADGVSQRAARHLHEKDRDGLAFLVRYDLRPPLSLASRLARCRRSFVPT